MIKIGMVRQMGRSMFLGDGAAASIYFWDPYWCPRPRATEFGVINTRSNVLLGGHPHTHPNGAGPQHPHIFGTSYMCAQSEKRKPNFAWLSKMWKKLQGRSRIL